MTPVLSSAFDLPEHLAAKDDPAWIGRDEVHFAAIKQCLEESIADLTSRLDAQRRSPGRTGQEPTYQVVVWRLARHIHRCS